MHIIAHEVSINDRYERQKISVTLRSDLLERIDEFADNNGMTRSGLLAIASTQYLNAMETMPSYKKLLNALASVTDGVLSGDMERDEAKAKLDAIQSTYSELSQK